MRVAVLATGPSMSQAIADRARAEYDAVVVVNQAYELAPWAAALAANDHAWWRKNPMAKEFGGRKFSANKVDGVEQVVSDLVMRSSSSGALGLEAARIIGGTEIELYGFENHGTHYFGAYESPLRNTAATRFEEFERQLEALGRWMAKQGIKIVNRTPGSSLRCFPCQS